MVGKAKAFIEGAEKPASSLLRIKTLTGIPAWKIRNREPKHRRVMLRVSESQLALLQTAAEHQEKSQQKVLEEIVWPVLEEKYGYESNTGPTEGQAPS